MNFSQHLIETKNLNRVRGNQSSSLRKLTIVKGKIVKIVRLKSRKILKNLNVFGKIKICLFTFSKENFPSRSKKQIWFSKNRYTLSNSIVAQFLLNRHSTPNLEETISWIRFLIFWKDLFSLKKRINGGSPDQARLTIAFLDLFESSKNAYKKVNSQGQI